METWNIAAAWVGATTGLLALAVSIATLLLARYQWIEERRANVSVDVISLENAPEPLGERHPVYELAAKHNQYCLLVWVKNGGYSDVPVRDVRLCFQRPDAPMYPYSRTFAFHALPVGIDDSGALSPGEGRYYALPIDDAVFNMRLEFLQDQGHVALDVRTGAETVWIAKGGPTIQSLFSDIGFNYGMYEKAHPKRMSTPPSANPGSP